MTTIIYVDDSNRVISVNKPVEGCKAIDVTEDKDFCSMSDIRKLCYCYREPSEFWLVVRADIVDLLDALYAENAELSDAIDTLIVSTLKGDV